MKGTEIVLGTWRGRASAVLLVNGQVEDFLVEPDPTTPRIGAIYRATLDRPMKGQGGAILKLGQGQTGFLRQAKSLAPGTSLLVQVTSYAEPGKAVPVTPRLLFKSRYAIVTPDAPGVNISRQIKDEDTRDRLAEIAHGVELNLGHGAILRSEAADAPDDHVADDLAAMAELAAQVTCDTEGKPELLLDGPDPAELAWRDWPRPDHFDDTADAFEARDMEDTLAQATSIRADLIGGAFAFVEPTRALVALDVNTGNDTSAAAGLKANTDLARALPRLLRVRGLGGQIVLDLAPMPKKDRARWESTLKSALRQDAVDTTFVGWTPLGHVELQRKRERVPIHEVKP